MNPLSLFTLYLNSLHTSSPIANTIYGQVQGIVEQSRDGHSYYAFKGIPYAKPPLGELRFRDPQEPDKWKGVKQTTVNPIFCVQLLSVLIPVIKNAFPPLGSEDCLYLSVATRSLRPKAKRPVLVYLHGGAFLGSAGPSIFGPTFLMDSDLVVVMANYRLTMLGFLSFEDDVLPGNMGLKDQNLVLRWVRDNIKNFGGDPNRVTIMGESAGAASVHYHALSPMSRGLYHQMIPISGSAFAVWAFSHPGDARTQAFELGKHLGCSSDNSSVVLDCLRKVPANALVRATHHFFGIWDLEPLRNIGPVFEKKRPGAFAPSSTKKWKPVDVPMLVGETSGEGLLKTILYKSIFKRKSWKWISKNWEEILPFSLRFLYNPNHKEVARRIRDYWFSGKELFDDSDIANLTAMYSIAGMKTATLKMVEEAKDRVYFFKFNYLGELSPALWVNDPNLPKMSFHAECMIYILHSIFFPALRGQDLEVSRELTKMVANFVIHGNPTPETGFFQPWTKENFDSLVIDNDGMRMEREGLPEDFKFWRSLCTWERFFGCSV